MLADETDRLKGLIDEVLDFSRLLENRKPYSPQRADLAALAATALDRCRKSASPRTIEAELSCEPSPFWAWLDPEAIERVLMNLIENAVKYSPPERTRVSVTVEKEGTNAVIKVKDEGYGIPANELTLIFERFYRGRSATEYQKTNGVGLGLSLARHIIEAHGGAITADSTEGRGSTFTVRIPLKENV